MTRKIFTFCHDYFPGTNNALINLSKATGITKHFVLATRGKKSPEIIFFIKYLKKERPSLAIFGGWSKTYEELIKRLRHEKIKFGVYWTSSPGQTDISQETEKLATIISNNHLRYRFFSSLAFASCLKKYFKNLYHLPLIFASLGLIARKQDKTVNNENVFVMSLFCVQSEYKRKNVLNSLLAVSSLKRNCRLYLNGLSKDRYYRKILDKLCINYRDFGWMDRKKYERVLGEVDLGLQVSFAESFNYVTAEHLARGIPVIATRMVPAVECLPEEVKKRIIIDDADNFLKISDCVQYFIDHPATLKRFSKKIQSAFLESNKRNIRIAREVLKRSLG